MTDIPSIVYSGVPNLKFALLPLALFLRHYGWGLLMVPTAWLVATVYFTQRRNRQSSPNVCMLMGLFCAIALLVIFLWASVKPSTRPF